MKSGGSRLRRRIKGSSIRAQGRLLERIAALHQKERPSMKPSRISFRFARLGDMVGCARVFLASATDLARRQGSQAPTIRAKDMARSLGHLQTTDPRGFHVAVRSGRVVAFASTILRGKTHFLSMFWALPSLQGKGVGRRLLTRAFTSPNPPASAVRCVYASLDPRAQALYVKFGMYPRGMFYMLTGPPKRSPRPRRTVDLVPVGEAGTTSPEMLSVAARYDPKFRASRRDADIRFIMSLPGARFFLVRARGKTLGYAVITDKGRIGPACVTDPRYGAGLAWALNEKAREMRVESISIVVPGVNASALDVFLKAGLKSPFYGAWMSAKPIGSFETYVLAGGMLL
jgi:GNAT superfamily N-acetyltransferase